MQIQEYKSVDFDANKIQWYTKYIYHDQTTS